MARDRLNFRKRDLNIVLQVLRAQGLTVARIDVERDGGFKIITNEAAAELDEDAIEAGTKYIDEVINHAFEQKGPQIEKRPAALRLHPPKPPRQR
jgi:hypothetical protein